MKKLSGILLAIAALAVGCGKVIEYKSGDYGAAQFINTSPSSPIFNVLVDGINQTATSLVYRGSTSYLNLRPGARNVVLRSNNPALPVDYISLPNENFETNKAATFIAYDTLLTPTGKLKYIRLSDTLTPAPDGILRVRYIPVAVNAPLSDITFLRVSVVPNDSVTITNRGYIGAAPSASLINSLSSYFQIPGGNYIIRQKIAGSQTVIATTPNPLMVPTPAGSFITSIGGIFKGNFTIYSTGTARGLPLSIGFVRQFP
ncbi:MAG: DUF4397 domain-containing protein [Ferruginibacter sp.]